MAHQYVPLFVLLEIFQHIFSLIEFEKSHDTVEHIYEKLLWLVPDMPYVDLLKFSS